jgi:hypothetical protein
MSSFICIAVCVIGLVYFAWENGYAAGVRDAEKNEWRRGSRTLRRVK